MNTLINYLYRDADNYKVYNHCVIEGEISSEQVAEIMDSLEDGEYFIPNQVGLPEKRFDVIDPKADHCYFELCDDDFELTEALAEIDLTVDQLVENFRKAKGSWDANSSVVNWIAILSNCS